MTGYKDIEMINHFITTMPDNWGIYIHIDKKSILNPENIINKANVFKKENIYWGGVEHLNAFLMLLKEAIRSKTSYDYYHLLSGQDYFSTHSSNFDHILGSTQKNYIEVHALPRLGWWGDGYDIIKYYTLSSHCDIRKIRYKVLNKILHYGQHLFKITRPLPNYPLYCGSVYCSLTKDAVETILTSSIAKDLLCRLSNTTCAEEIFFQTVLMNSRLKDTIVNDNLRYIDWNTKKPPKILQKTDFEKIVLSNTLFCRKIEYKTSIELINELDSIE